MTVIAWDGRTLAADKRNTCVGNPSTVTKIFKIEGVGLVGFAGDADHALCLLHWFRNDMVMADYPKVMESSNASALLIDTAGQAWSYAKLAHPQRIEDRFCAMGAGRDYALAAMHLGKTAREAVEVACALDVFCGNGIDTLEL